MIPDLLVELLGGWTSPLGALVEINLRGFLALLVGVLVTVPLSMVASTHLYRRLEAAQETVQQAPAAAGF